MAPGLRRSRAESGRSWNHERPRLPQDGGPQRPCHLIRHRRRGSGARLGGGRRPEDGDGEGRRARCADDTLHRLIAVPCVSHSYDTRASPSYRGGDNALGPLITAFISPAPELPAEPDAGPRHPGGAYFTRKGFRGLGPSRGSVTVDPSLGVLPGKSENPLLA